MTTPLKRTLLATSLAFGLFAALQLPQAMAQSEHEGHHPVNAQAGKPAAQKAQPAAPKQGDMRNQGQMGAERMSSSGMDHNQMMDHGAMDHAQMMQQMHDQHMNQGQMDHGNMGQGQMNHGSMPPAQRASAAKDGKHDQ